MTFEAWLRTVCFQAPTSEAHDLAKCAWEASQSLSQEAVRDEALGYCWLIECNDGTGGGPHYWAGREPSNSRGPWTINPFEAVRFQRKDDADRVAYGYSGTTWKAVCHHFDDALKREPNAAVARCSDGLLCPRDYKRAQLTQQELNNPAPAAPDVASMVKRLRELASDPGLSGIPILGEAAAILARLGQGWVPVSEGRPQNSSPVLIQWYDGDSDGMLVAQYNGIRWTYDGGIVPPSTEVTHWMPLPKSPGASDD